MQQFEQDQMIQDPENYKWGVFYFNHRDNRTIVPKRAQWMGWTMNFANPKSYLILALIIAFGVLASWLD